MTWDFFKQVHKFSDLSAGNLSTNAFALYIRLLVINDKAGRVEWFGVTNERLMAELGITLKVLNTARSTLIQMGFVEYSKGKSHIPSRYKLIPLNDDFLKKGGKFSEYFSPKNFQLKNGTKTGTEKGSKNGTKTGTEKGSETGHLISVPNPNLTDPNPASMHAREEDEDFDRVLGEISRHSDVIRPIRPNELPQVSELVKVHSAETVLLAVSEAVKTAKERGEVIAHGAKYLAAILESWKRGSVKSGRSAEVKRDIANDRYAAIMSRDD